MGYLTISTNVRRYQTHHRRELFLSARQRTGALRVCNTFQLIENVIFAFPRFAMLVQKHKLPEVA